jgi:soluble lytic murein transglycosylase-like protein
MAVMMALIVIAIRSSPLRAGTGVNFVFYSYRVKATAARLRERSVMFVPKTAFASLCAAFLALAGAAPATGAETPPEPETAPSASPRQDGTELKAPDAGRDFDAIEAKKKYQALIRQEAERNGLPPDIADAVAAIESGYDPAAVGAVGEMGLMQVRPETAVMLGFTGNLSELARPDVNIHFGVTYLSQAWRLAGGDLCRTLMKYRAGHGEEAMSPLSVLYCGRARAYLASAGSPFADAASVPFVYFPPLKATRPRMARRGPPKIRTAAVSRAFWAAEETRVKAVTQRIEAKWRQMAAR